MPLAPAGTERALRPACAGVAMHATTLALAMATAIVMAGCARPGTEPGGAGWQAPVELVPGMALTYKDEHGSVSVHTVAAREQHRGIDAWRLELDEAGDQSTTWVAVDDLRLVGVEAMGSRLGVDCDGSRYYPMADHNVTCQIGTVACIKATADYRGRSRIEVPAGKFDVAEFVYADRHCGSGEPVTVWFAPELGHEVARLERGMRVELVSIETPGA